VPNCPPHASPHSHVFLPLSPPPVSTFVFVLSQTYFHMSVILIFAHDDGGSAGLILNRWAGEWSAGRVWWVTELSALTSPSPTCFCRQGYSGRSVTHLEAQHLPPGQPHLSTRRPTEYLVGQL